MRLDQNGLENRSQWNKAGYGLFEYDRKAVRKATKEKPVWIHFGAGNLFRAYQANAVQKLLNEGVMNRGLIVAEGYDYEIIEKIYHPHDDYTILITFKADGSMEKTVIGSIVEALTLDFENQKDSGRLREIFCSDSLQMVSFTITEKGYSLVNGKGETLPAIEEDYKNGPDYPVSYIGKVTSLLYTRFLHGARPIAMVSMDNCSHNGDRLYEAVLAFAEKWTENKKAEKGFLEYIKDNTKVSFPWTMIDKITPRPDASVEKMLKEDGLEDAETTVTSKNTYAAPFVNAEECEYLVIEDAFPNGRPKLEKAGFLFTTKATVDKVEKMKVCTCLNPLHTALAVFGCLLGYSSISEEMKDKTLRRLVEEIGYTEGLPVVVNPGIIHPREFIDTVLNVRFPNPFMPDTPQRIATDTSQKLAVRFGETIKAYAASPKLRVRDLKMIPLVFAGWLRYLKGVDDNGTPFELSPDPMLDTLQPYLKEIRQGGVIHEDALRPVLSNEKIFGVNLYQVGMAEKVCEYLSNMCAGRGAVRSVLEEAVK